MSLECTKNPCIAVGILYLYQFIYKLLEMPAAFLEVLVEAVACGGGAEYHAALCKPGSGFDCLREVLYADLVHHRGGYHIADTVAAVRQEYHIFNVPGVEKIRQLVVGYIALHAAEDNAVGAVRERLHSRYRRLRNGADAVVDVLHAVHCADVFKAVLKPHEIRKGSEAAVGIGSGGGHNEKAGGFISMKLYEENYPTLHSEAYFNNRMAEYFKSYTLIFADKTKLDVSTMQKYKRLKRPICYVKATDIAEVGTSISVRSKCGSVDVQVKEDIYFAVERNGIIHFVRSDFFQKYLYEIEQKPSEDYFAQVQYMPTIKNWSDGNTYRIDNYAKLCMPKDTFIIYAKKLTNCVKVFPKWNGEKYMRGVPGDYLAASGDDLHNVFIEPGSIFLDNYEQI